ncbi:MAG: Ribosomal RNA small subunit methyltransferase E [Candidatus Cloacimonetes bacterium ADurb.Bin089]|nr:MAG: Ribosomal RNA small subunit methyltransferase E [Candidatus Cloacimonetes bacterium ADurb.Bin089]
MPSIYAPDLSEDKNIITVKGEEFHHLINVKRIKSRETVKLNSGAGLIAEGKLTEVTKDYAVIEITKREKFPFPERPFAIAFALLKNRNDELVIEKCTELGVTAFYPLLTDYSVRAPSKNTVSRFERLALSAIKQCDNPWLPRISEPLPLKEAVKKLSAEDWKPVLCSEQRPAQRISDLPNNLKPCFIIGPEGGFREEEFSFFADQDIPSISLCNLITRAETAAIAAAAQFAALICSKE